MTPALADDLALAHRLADAADELTAAAFTGEAVAHELKPDGSPVSETDLLVERRISEILAAERPGDGVLGEEVGGSGPVGRRWILDGIDGTVLFVAGVRGWATEIALVVDGEPVVGVTTSGADGRRWWAARGAGAWRSSRGGAPEPLAVSGQTDLDGGARYSLIPPLDALPPDRRRLVDRLDAAASYVPPVEHGAVFVAEGRVEACLQLGGGAWDFAALAVVVEEAGGRFSDLDGGRDLYGGGPVVFSNGRTHDAVLAALRS
ncbi:MAG TPA: inositol monophosphatase family protein [Acidimicrobiales bacterium]|nr:inositol monophosphatase family protein [Acidimicrobiales bacterium]